jgi:CRP/FNR family transcriptional regulator, cyclic AMP receptor protein
VTGTVDAALLRQCALFAQHLPDELSDIAQYLVPLRATAGTRLFTQGNPAEGLYVVERGSIRIVARLPGDKVVELGRIGPGEMFGEVSLVIQSPHSTSAEVLENFRGFLFTRRHFEMLRADLRPSAFRTMNALTETICKRIRGQIVEIQQCAPATHRPVRGTGLASKGRRSAGAQPAPQDLFSPQSLSRLPLFQPYADREIDALLAAVRPRILPRGTPLFAAGDLAQRCFLIVRGAVRHSVMRKKGPEQLAILGPSQMAGVLSMMDGLANPDACETREDTHLLEMNRQAFQRFRAAADPMAFKFFESVNRSLVSLLRKNNRYLSLLAVQGRLPSHHRQST